MYQASGRRSLPNIESTWRVDLRKITKGSSTTSQCTVLLINPSEVEGGLYLREFIIGFSLTLWGKGICQSDKAQHTLGPQASFPKQQAKQNMLLKAHFSKTTFWIDSQVLQRWWVSRSGQIFFPPLGTGSGNPSKHFPSVDWLLHLLQCLGTRD